MRIPKSQNKLSMSMSHSHFNTRIYALPHDKTSFNQIEQPENKNNNLKAFLVLALLVFV